MSRRRGKAILINPSCRWSVLYRVDGRTLEGKTLTFVRSRLVDFVGGDPDARQIILIERAAWLSLRIALKESKLAQRGPDAMTIHDDLHYLSWVSLLIKILDKLGVNTSGTGDSWRDILA